MEECKTTPVNKTPMYVMNEIKIRFKNGDIGYFKLLDSNIERVFDVLGDSIRDSSRGIIDVIDLSDDKRTIINIQDITSFGYSNVAK